MREVGGPSVSEIRVLPDKVVPAAWRVEHTDADANGVVTIFAGFEAEFRHVSIPVAAFSCTCEGGPSGFS